MADTLTPAERSERMSRVKGRDTAPEMLLRVSFTASDTAIACIGATFGCPDLTFGKCRKVIFVQGSFWHRHSNSACKLARLPKSRLDFWLPKLEANRRRDAKNQERLAAMGWKVLVIWECQLGDQAMLKRRIRSFLGP